MGLPHAAPLRAEDGPPEAALSSRVLRRFAEPEARDAWAAALRNPSRPWRDRTRRFLTLDGLHPQAALPDGEATFRFRARHQDQPATLEITTAGGRTLLQFSGLADAEPSVDLSWGPPRTRLLLLRYSFELGSLRVIRYTVLDLESRRVLGEEYR